MKTQVDCYYIRGQHLAWGYFLIHPNGLLVAHTDYGTYGYRWTAIGDRTIKEFLLRIDTHYLLGKVARDNWVDEDKTKARFLRHVVEWRKERRCDKDRARELYDGISERDGQEMITWALDQPEIYNCDGWEMIRHDYPPAARMFASELWPLFVAELRKEVAVPAAAGREGE